MAGNSNKNNEVKQDLSLFEYERKYVREENAGQARFLVGVVASFIGIIIVTCLTLLTLKLWDIHMYAGIAAATVSVLIFIFLFIVPLIKILHSDYFITNVDHRNVNKAKRHNKELRKKLAEKMVDFATSIDGISWDKEKIVDKLNESLQKNDHNKIKEYLTALYKGPVKQDAKKIILRKSLKCGLYTAVSQESKADALIVATLNFQLVRDLVYLYGFRPSDTRMVRIFAAVLENILILYGIGKIQFGEKILSSVGSKVPFVNVFSMLIDSGIQGTTGSLLTMRIGYQTIHYLNKEYKLQSILDGVCVDVDGEEEKNAEATLKEEYEEEKKIYQLKA